MYDDQSAAESRTKAMTPARAGVGLGALLVLLAAAAVAHDSGPAPRPVAEPGSAATSKPLVAPAKGAVSPRPSPSLTRTAVLPDLVGTSLREARKAAETAGFSLVTSHDATGRGRVQISEGHWTVCAQTPLPGTHPTFTEVDFATVARDERCPR